MDEMISLPSRYTDSLLVFINKNINQGEGYRHIRNYLEEMFEDVSGWTHGRKAYDILDSALLETMLRDELEKEGIRLRFSFGVYFPFSGKILYNDSAEIIRLARETDLVFSLFPNFKLSKPVYLVLDFPDEQQYLFTNLSKVLSISLLLTLILIWSFYFITRNTYRQKKLGEMKNDFINNMTHEFKTPVSTISLACEALRDKDVEKSVGLIDNYLKIIDEENRRLGKLAEQILQTAIIDKGHLYLSFEEVDLHALVRQVIEKYEPAIRQREGTIGTKLFAENSMLSGDRTHLYNMISNLVDNAIKYSKERPSIEILTTGTDQRITLSIRDQGIGISKSNQKKIFEKLYRVPTGNLHNTKGFGLGLSYVKYIVDRHEGAIHVESELHRGSRFAITLPRQPLRIHEHKRT
jgi:two-component system phosphate regulon sensor histidine kinase PhoR